MAPGAKPPLRLDPSEPERGRLVDGAVIWDGSLGPASGSPDRAVGSVRRTSTVDIRWIGGVGGTLVLEGRARDLRTDEAGNPEVVGFASTNVTIEAGQIVAVVSDPAIPVQDLVGVPAQRLRRAIGSHLPEYSTDGSLIGLLLDEVPVTALIAGHAFGRIAMLRSDGSGPPAEPLEAAFTVGALAHTKSTAGAGTRGSICSGWAQGEFMARNAERGLRPQHYESVAVPPLTRKDDPLGWHEMAESLPPTSMRRSRRLDLVRMPDGDVEIDGVFRDQYFEEDGRTTGVHEYTLVSTVQTDGTLTMIEVSPRVLPGPDCPGALASAQRLVGRSLAEVRALVRREFNGTSTCTHLNDELRALGDLHALLHLV
jgi:hypothetical protein